MKKIKILKRILALVLVLSITLTILPPAFAEAVEYDPDITLLEYAAAEARRMNEGISDSISTKGPKAGNWWPVIHLDYLRYDFFHKLVQKDIEANNSNIELEEWLDVKIPIGNGKYHEVKGRADVIMVVKEGVEEYIWEVKPYSYSVSPKRDSARIQLGLYVASDQTKYHIGGGQIQGNTITKGIAVLSTDGIKYVTYTIDYWVESDGLIFYTFKRMQTKEKVPEFEYETVKVTEKILIPAEVLL